MSSSVRKELPRPKRAHPPMSPFSAVEMTTLWIYQRRQPSKNARRERIRGIAEALKRRRVQGWDQ